MEDKLKLSLIDNAHDFIYETIKYADANESKDWKYALLHLCSAIELVMKAILEKEHWSLIFEDIDKATSVDLASGNFKSATWDKLIERIINIIGKHFSDREQLDLNRLRSIRNSITHYSIEINIEKLKSIIARGLNIFTKLYQVAIGEDESKEFVYFLNNRLKEYKKYVRLHIAQVKETLDKSERPEPYFSVCPHCFQDALVVDRANEVYCLFCGYRTSFEELALCSEGPGGPCPVCKIGYLGLILYNNEDGEFICAKCGFCCDVSYNVGCGRCGENYWDETGERIMCDNCWDTTVNQMK
jgi:hypothetical protein